MALFKAVCYHNIILAADLGHNWSALQNSRLQHERSLDVTCSILRPSKWPAICFSEMAEVGSPYSAGLSELFIGNSCFNITSSPWHSSVSPPIYKLMFRLTRILQNGCLPKLLPMNNGTLQPGIQSSITLEFCIWQDLEAPCEEPTQEWSLEWYLPWQAQFVLGWNLRDTLEQILRWFAMPYRQLWDHTWTRSKQLSAAVSA